MSLYSLGRWAWRHRGRVLSAWLALLVVLGLAVAGFGGTTQDSFDIPGTESQEAIDSLHRTFPQLSGTSAYLIVIAPDGSTMRTQQARSLISATVDEMKDIDGVAEAVSPYSDMTSISISDDDRAAMVQIQFTKSLEHVDQASVDALEPTAERLRDAGYTAKFGGDVFTDTGPELSATEAVGVVVAFIVLLLALGSARAAIMPIITALIGVGVTMELTYLAAHTATISSTAPLLAIMIGLAVGIDYALFIGSRHREQLGDGVDPEESAARAVATAGSAVIFAGVTVMIALVGLAVANIPFLTVMGIVAAGAVLVAVLVAITVLPALLGFAGGRLTPKHRTKKTRAGFARRWVQAATRLPLLTIVLVVGALAVVAIPATGLRLALPDNGSAPKGSTARTAYELVDSHFGPGFNGALLINANIITSHDPVGDVDKIADEIKKIPGVKAIGLATPNPTADTGVIQVIPTTSPSDPRTADLVERIRDYEPTVSDELGIDYGVTGQTAVAIDVSERLRSALVPFAIVVVGLSLVLLTTVFRSILVPLKASLGYLVSVAASFGAVVAVFQNGHLRSLVNLDHAGPLISFLPIIVMGVLFGLAMDYEVFLVSRMKEEYARTQDPDSAIRDGFVGSARVVTAAAVIMFAVFAAFVPEGDPNIKPIAFALAVGVFVDAFFVRMLIVPAVMKLFGHITWRIPRVIDRMLPELDVEGEALQERLELAGWPGRDTAISAAGLTKSGPEGIVFNDVNIELDAGERLVVYGPSGSGKTSLLLTLAGRMDFDAGRLRVSGHLLPQEGGDVRAACALAEFTGVNDLEDNLTVEQHIAERLAMRSLSIWVRHKTVQPVLDSLNEALERGCGRAGVRFSSIAGKRLVSSLSRLERTFLGVVLALISQPQIVFIEDIDAVRVAEDIQALWYAVAFMDSDVTIVASAMSKTVVEGPVADESRRVRLLELDTARTMRELMI